MRNISIDLNQAIGSESWSSNNIPEVNSLQSDRGVPRLLEPALLRSIRRALTLSSLETACGASSIAREVGCELTGVGVEDWARCVAEDGCHCECSLSVGSGYVRKRRGIRRREKVVEMGITTTAMNNYGGSKVAVRLSDLRSYWGSLSYARRCTSHLCISRHLCTARNIVTPAAIGAAAVATAS